ncbi:hypothetical protein [Xenorhabdus sp. TS4]|nr:hypothetical protein [Xenorhabdus sp. TS4]
MLTHRRLNPQHGKGNLEELYCCVDDFCQKFIPLWHQQLIENG